MVVETGCGRDEGCFWTVEREDRWGCGEGGGVVGRLGFFIIFLMERDGWMLWGVKGLGWIVREVSFEA